LARYRRQHLVSRVIISRFSSQGHVAHLELDSGELEPRSPASCMYMPNFISAAPAEAEQLWSSVENRLPAALASVDDGTILDRPQHVATLKDCVALHVARSKAMAWTREESLQRASSKLKAEIMATQPGWLLERFRQQHRIIGVGFQALEMAADDFIRAAAPMVNTPETFWASVRELFGYSKNLFAGTALEIVSPEAGAGEFLLGDFPAVPLAKSAQLLGGPRGGVTIDDAATVVMPLGPKHLVGLGPTSRFEHVPEVHVNTLNGIQAMNALHEACFRPGADFVDFVKTTRQLAVLPGGRLRTPQK